MRRLVVALAAVATAVALTACSSAGASTSSAPPTPPAGTAAPTAAQDPSAVPVSATNKLSPQIGGAGIAFPATDREIPDVIKDHVAAHQPMIVFFFDPDQPSSGDQKDEIDAVLKQYRGLIDLVSFDVSGALPDPVTKQAKRDKEAEQAALLTQKLGIGFTPYVVLVDKQGTITGRYRGFIDRSLLVREILKATQ